MMVVGKLERRLADVWDIIDVHQIAGHVMKQLLGVGVAPRIVERT